MANVGLSTAKGAIGGAGVGAELGSMILPGIGTGVGAVLGAVVGGLSGNEKSRNINSALDALDAVPAVDPNMIAFKDKLGREKRSVESGFTTDFQVARDITAQAEAGGMSVAAEMALTNPALALMAMSQVSNGADSSINKALGTISTRSMGYTQMMGDLMDKISARELQVGIMKASQHMGLATREMSDFNSNANAGMMKLAGSGIGDIFKGLNIGGSGFSPSNPAFSAGFTADPSLLANPLGLGVSPSN